MKEKGLLGAETFLYIGRLCDVTKVRNTVTYVMKEKESPTSTCEVFMGDAVIVVGKLRATD